MAPPSGGAGRGFVSQEFDMNKLALPHDAFVFVGDGRKALFLRNAGDEKFINLTTERVFVDDNPPTHEQGTDRPGRTFKRAGTNLRSGVETTNWQAAAMPVSLAGHQF